MSDDQQSPINCTYTKKQIKDVVTQSNEIVSSPRSCRFECVCVCVVCVVCVLVMVCLLFCLMRLMCHYMHRVSVDGLCINIQASSPKELRHSQLIVQASCTRELTILHRVFFYVWL